MKNLKKVLSLVLVFAMVLGFGVSAAAADYSDWDEVQNKEAVTLLTALNVMQGDSRGFRPADTLNRAEAITIIAKALWSGENNSTLYQGNNPGNFPDLVDEWYRGAINFGFAKGIISGHGNGKFAPKDNVNGIQFLKMALTSLGFDQARYENTPTWSTNIITDADTAGLLAGIKANFDPSADLTRDYAALIAFNMINANMRNADGSILRETNSEYKWVSKTVTEDNIKKEVWSYGPSTSYNEPTFGAVYFGFKVYKNAILVQNGSAKVDANSPIVVDPSKANGVAYFNAAIKVPYYDATQATTAYDYVGIMKGDTLPTDLGYAYNVVVRDGAVISWERSAINAEIEHNPRDVSKTTGNVGDNRFVNYARVGVALETDVDNIFNTTAVQANIKNESNAKAFVNALVSLVGSDLPGDYDTYDEIWALLQSTNSSAGLAAIATALKPTGIAKIYDSTGALTDAMQAAMTAYLNNDGAAAAFGATGNDTTFVDNNGDGKADYMFVTAYTYNIVTKITGTTTVNGVKYPTYEYANPDTNRQDKTSQELAKGDVVVYHDIAGYRYIDEILEATEGKIERYNSGNNVITFGGTTYQIAHFTNATEFNSSYAGVTGTYYFFNGCIVAAKDTVTPETHYAVIYGAYYLRSTSSQFGGNAAIDYRVLAALDDGTIGVFNVNNVKVGTDTFGSPAAYLASTGADVKNLLKATGITNTDFINATVNNNVPLEWILGKTAGSGVQASGNPANYGIVQYSLTADGKGINLGTASTTDDGSSSENYTAGGNKIGGKIVDANSVVFLQKEDGSFSVFKGIGKIPSLKLGTASTAPKSIIAVDKYAAADQAGLGWLVVGYNAGVLDTTVPGAVFAILGGADAIGGGKFEFEMFNGTSVETYQSIGDVVANGIYDAISVGADGVVSFSPDDRLNDTTAKVGHISNYSDGTYRFVASDATVATYAYNSNTNYYLIDGMDSGKLTAAQAAELLPQTAPTAGRYTVVIADSGATIIIMANEIVNP